MTRTSDVGEWAGRIRDLRDAVGLSQEAFAQELRTSQGMVSSWEKGEAKYAPSAEMYLRIGALAANHGHDPVWLWEQAGMRIATVEAVIEKRLKARKAPPSPGDIERVRLVSEATLLNEAAPLKEQDGRWLILPAELVANPASTVAFEVKRAGGFAFGVGDTVVVDRSVTDLRSLWGTAVLVDLTPGERPWYRERWPRGLFMGQLLCEDRGGDHLTWGAELHPLSKSFESLPLTIGLWQCKELARQDGSGNTEYLSREETKRAGAMARLNLRPAEGCRILGRMVCWFSSVSEEAKHPMSIINGNVVRKLPALREATGKSFAAARRKRRLAVPPNA